MAMTAMEKVAKQQILDILGEQGYRTYSIICSKFDINLTEDPEVVAYMDASRARIVINANLNIKQVSFIVRHEILHHYLEHIAREQAYNKAKGSAIDHTLANIAADYEISNRGYTDADKQTAIKIDLNGREVRGLVTEFDHPEWVNYTMEQILDELSKIEDAKDNLANRLFGDITDSEIQQAEELERQANAASDDAGDDVDESNKDLAKKLSKAIKAMKDAKEEQNEKPFDDAELEAKKEKVRARIQEIEDILRDRNTLADIDTDIATEKALEKAAEKAAKQLKDLKDYNRNPLVQLKLSLDMFIRNEIGYGRDKTWTRFNKTYINTNLIKRGTSRTRPSHVPLINVYHDVSGSFSDPAKTEQAIRAISTLKQYQDKGLIKIKVYYFATRVSDSRENAGRGTEIDEVLQHIHQTKPDNVIVLTDSDASKASIPTKVDGGVWQIYYGSKGQALIDNLKGKKYNKILLIDKW